MLPSLLPTVPASHSARVVIVGAGLGGLCAAHLLQEAGVGPCLVLEARGVPGGRILSVPGSVQPAGSAAPAEDRFDLGPTWFWPELQPELQRLIDGLGLRRFAQFEQGDMVIERSRHEPPLRMRGPLGSPPSMRLQGGMAMLVEALQRRLAGTRIATDQAVRRVRCLGAAIEIDTLGPGGDTTTWQAEHLLLALPPRLAATAIEFSPALPPALQQQWLGTATWMAPHAKYLALYDQPFWRELGLSGAARSAVGPLGEIHDASMPDGSAALFGFFGVAAATRQAAGEDALRSHCRAQLQRLFGPQAAAPRAEFIKDWASDPHTATAADLDPGGHPAHAPAATAASGVWHGRLTGVASEWSPQFPGYLAGALEAARLGTAALVAAAAAGRPPGVAPAAP